MKPVKSKNSPKKKSVIKKTTKPRSARPLGAKGDSLLVQNSQATPAETSPNMPQWGFAEDSTVSDRPAADTSGKWMAENSTAQQEATPWVGPILSDKGSDCNLPYPGIGPIKPYKLVLNEPGIVHDTFKPVKEVNETFELFAAIVIFVIGMLVGHYL